MIGPYYALLPAVHMSVQPVPYALTFRRPLFSYNIRCTPLAAASEEGGTQVRNFSSIPYLYYTCDLSFATQFELR
jgi:hypothetical protein